MARLPARRRAVVLAALLLALAGASARSSSPTPPADAFGASIGDDDFLASYTQLERYWKRLDAQSDRLELVDIGRTEEGRTQWMAVVSAPENLRRLERYREISRRLAMAEGLTDDEASGLAAEGKAVVWISGGLHATEVLGAQQLIETVYQLVGGSDPETQRILRDVIVLAVPANPDGHELVADWYMREPDPARRTLAGLPRLYQKYVGHDLNRDFYLASQAETINMSRVLYHEWFPQIVYDHHQTAPAGTVMFAPPFGGPVNPVLDPLVPATIDLLGAAMHARFAAEGKAGVTTRAASPYSTWWNGGLRTTAYFHNQIGLLTETTGGPTPDEVPFVAERQHVSPDLPRPIQPQPWHFRQSLDYSLSANRALLDAASRHREHLLLGVYRMGRNAVERGGSAGYVLPSDQPDFPTATRLVEALLKSGVVVHRAIAPFTVAGRLYPADSYVVRAGQAFGPHVRDMFEPQRYPDMGSRPGEPLTPPYDSAGWTLAFQMGVRFDRVSEGLDGPFVPLSTATPPPGRVAGPSSPAGYLLSHHVNDAAVAVNRLLASGVHVYWPRDRSIGGQPDDTGAIYVPAEPSSRRVLERAAAELGLSVTGVHEAPAGDALRLSPVRVGLWDRYGGSSSSGWIRWLLERYEFPFEVVYAQDLEEERLADRFDVLILSDEARLDAARATVEPSPDRLPAEYRRRTGTITTARTLPRLHAFVEGGGTLLAIGGATAIGAALGLPLSSALVDGRDGVPLSAERYDVPGSVLRVRVDNRTPLGYGFTPDVDVFFDNSPVFRLLPARGGPDPVAWFDSPTPLRSGWARGQGYLRNGVAVVDAPLGRGRVLLFGPRIAFRAQSHGTFKFLFNGIHSAAADPAVLP